MAGILLKAAGVVLVAIVAALFPTLQLSWKAIGYGRVLQPVGDFPYKCRRIDQQPRLRACEDMWLSEATRQLFLACGDPMARPHWSPVVQELNWEARSRIDAIIALDLDKPGPDGSFEHRVLPLKGYTGNDQGRIFVNGIDGADKVQEDGTVKVTIALTNYGPSVDPATGAVLDQRRVGSNATIEIFETGPEAQELRHVRTFADWDGITIPNRPALVGTDVEDGFYVTNESKERAGLKGKFNAFIPHGNVVYCSGSGSGCREVAGGHRYPNGIHRARDGLVYVPASGDMAITVYREVAVTDGSGGATATTTRTLERVGFLDLDGHSPDNVSEDADGDLWVATFPKPFDAMAMTSDPLNFWPRSTVFRLRSSVGEDGEVALTADKMIEDRDKEVLPGATAVVHDAKTGRLFLSGVATPFITVCDPR
ncbi:hypothetical protein RB595_010074 [Gaeumannomyces hyphopodioides]